MIGCYYRRVGADRDNDEYQLFEPTDSTRSNWDRTMQHGSPPLALLTKLVEERAAGSGKRIGRICFDMLGPIPVSPVRARAWIERPGRRIAMYAADMIAERTVARVSAWLLATSDTADVAADRHRPLVEGEALPLPDSWARAGGYIDSLSLRRQRTEPDAAAVYWLRSRRHVVDNDPDTSVQKLAAVVDTANGLGAVLNFRRFVFMNTDTVLHLHRTPTGSDFALRSRASIGPDGIGVTSTEMFDRAGFIGVCAQTLLVQRRQPC